MASAPLIGSRWKVTLKWWPWSDSEVSGQSWLQSRTEPLPTSTRSGGVDCTGRWRNWAMRGWRKLCVLPLSMSMVRHARLITPKRRNVSDEGKPYRACKLMWGYVLSVMGSETSLGSASWVVDVFGLRSSISNEGLSTMNRSTRPLQRWIALHFSSQL